MMKMMAYPALILILTAGVALGQDERRAINGQVYPLDMELDSVDDQYDGCRKKMAELVKDTFFPEELNNTERFGEAWRKGEREDYCNSPGHGLSRNNCIALFVYTDTVHQTFNPAVRHGKTKYTSSTFEWYSLQFYLTEALQILKASGNHWELTYRGTNVSFDKNVLNKEVRFGSFASSSRNYTIAQGFGNESCFQIFTCLGVSIQNYSYFPSEEEVLIPPYETFVVTDVLNKTAIPDLWCETVYVLNSTGTRSDLNCAVASGESLWYHK